MIGGGLGVGGGGDGDVVLVDEDFVLPTADAILLGEFGEPGEAVAAEPLAEVGLPRGTETVDFVAVLERVAAPVVLEVELPRARVGHDGECGRGDVGIGIAGEEEVGVHIAPGEDAVDVVKVRELRRDRAREALFDLELPLVKTLRAHTAGAGEVVGVAHEGGGDERGARGALAEEFGAEIEDGVVLPDEGVAVARAEGRGRRDRSAIDGGSAGREPRGDGVGGVPGERGVVGGVAALVAAADDGFGEGLIAEGAGEAALLVEIPLAPALGVLVEAEETETQFAADEDMVVVELVAKVVPRADDGFGGGGRAAELGKLARERDGAAGGTEAKEDGIGPARHLRALDVVEIDGDGGLRVVDRGRAGDAAHAEAEIVAGGVATGRVVEAVGRVLDLAFDVGGVGEHRLKIGGADVGEKLFGEW